MTMSSPAQQATSSAALCSFFIPGLGQLLQGRLFVALIQFVLAGVLWYFLLGWLINLWSVDRRRHLSGPVKNLTVCYLPAQWLAFDPAQLRDSVCVVIDVIRATSTIATALANGASGIRPVASVAEAEQLKALRPDRLLAANAMDAPCPASISATRRAR